MHTRELNSKKGNKKGKNANGGIKQHRADLITGQRR